jgi:hypothetical protein
MGTRRDILGVLGLGAVATATVATESMATIEPSAGVPGLAMPGPEFQLKVAQALENLARAIRIGDATAMGVAVHSEMKLEEWFTHHVTFKVEVPLEAAAPLSF